MTTTIDITFEADRRRHAGDGRADRVPRPRGARLLRHARVGRCVRPDRGAPAPSGRDGGVVTAPPTSVEDYLAGLPDGTREVVDQVVAAVRRALPECEEKIRYGMPAFMFGGARYGVHVAGWKNHVGLYPVARLDPVLESELEPPHAQGHRVVRVPRRRALRPGRTCGGRAPAGTRPAPDPGTPRTVHRASRRRRGRSPERLKPPCVRVEDRDIGSMPREGGQPSTA